MMRYAFIQRKEELPHKTNHQFKRANTSYVKIESIFNWYGMVVIIVFFGDILLPFLTGAKLIHDTLIT